jgi:hypothetical protein
MPTNMKRSVPLLVLALLVATSTLVGIAADGRAATVSVANVTVTPEQPNPGEQFTVRVTIQNAQSSSNAYQVTDVYVRRPNAARDLARVENLGTIPPGSRMSVPVTLSLDKVGSRNLRLYIAGRSGGDVQTLQYPLLVTVRRGGPQVNVETGEAVVGTEATVRVQAVNGEDQPIRNVRLTLAGENATLVNDSRVAPTLGAGESRTFPFAVTPTTRNATLRTELTYTTPSGTTRVVRDVTRLRAEPLEEDVAIDAQVLGEGADPPVAVDVSNFGNAPLEDVVVGIAANGSTVARRPAAPIPPGATGTVRFNVTGVSADELGVRAEYETGERSGTVETTVRYRTNPGRIELTGVDYEREGERIHLSGSVSNVGLGGVDAVVVSVVPRQGVTPARPYREYFVGRVPASDFVSFDLYAQVDQGVESIPVRISYIAEGDRRESVREIHVGDLPPDQTGSRSGGGPLSLPLLIGGGVAALLVIGVGVYAFARR